MKQLNTTKLTKGGKSMEKEYDIEKLNPRKNPYAKRVKKQITINIDGDTIDFFKAKSEKCGIPYQTLINLYLSDCKEQNRELELKWNQPNIVQGCQQCRHSCLFIQDKFKNRRNAVNAML